MEGRNREMEPTQELVDAIYRDRVQRARRRPLNQKVLSGAELFEEAYERMEAGILMQHPGLDAAGRLDLIQRRFERLRQVRGS
jgi:hypothetical protein